MKQNKQKTVEQKIIDTEMLLKQVIGQADLNVSVIELIIRNLHSEIKMLAQENLNNILLKQQENKSEEIEDGNTNEEGQTS